MGQTLSEPVTAKESAYCQNSLYKVGSSCMQGWRIHMEDSHTHILSLPDDPETAFFGVYDGHGGASVAQYAGKHLHKLVVKRDEFKSDVPQALKQAFLDIDEQMLADETMQSQMAGSTAVTCVIKGQRLYCANAGDSRMIACISDKVEVLSHDHKPNNENELKRIYEGGGFVEYNRVNGNLALSRALGDFVFKRNSDKIPEEQIVTAYPDIEERTISADWEFAVLACDGIWDVMRNDEVKQFVRQRIAMGLSPELICEQLMTCCLAPDCLMGGLGGDNMTVVLVCFLHGRPYEDLVARCASSLNGPELTFASVTKRNSVVQMSQAMREQRVIAGALDGDDDFEDDDEDEEEEEDQQQQRGDKAKEEEESSESGASAQRKAKQQQNGGESERSADTSAAGGGSPRRVAAGGDAAPSGALEGAAAAAAAIAGVRKVQRPTVRKGEDCTGDDDEGDLK